MTEEIQGRHEAFYKLHEGRITQMESHRHGKSHRWISYANESHTADGERYSQEQIKDWGG